MSEQSGIDDSDRRLAEIAMTFCGVLEGTVPAWLKRTVGAVLAEGAVALDPASTTELDRLCDSLGREIHQRVAVVVCADVDAAKGSPLHVIRRSLGPANAFLATQSVPLPQRDDFDQRRDPDDVYGLAPANFASIDPALHEPAITWGAARAFVHLERRRARSEGEAR